MSWNATVSGEFHEVVKSLRNLRDVPNAPNDHLEVAKEMALCAIDKAPQDLRFFITLTGHNSGGKTYSLSANFTAQELK